MRLIVARHGNTFNLHEKPVFIGCKEDLELTDIGIKQADLLASYFVENRIKISQIISGELKRTAHSANIIANRIQDATNSDCICKIDSRLNELDYGDWKGLSSEDVREKYFEDFKGWKKGVWPSSSNWPEKEEDIKKEILSLSEEIVRNNPKNSTVLLVTSNGRIRYFAKLIPGAFEKLSEKEELGIKTGNICEFEINELERNLLYWNKHL